MYGTPTCKDCVIAKQVFQELGTDYEFINMVNDEEATQKAIELGDSGKKVILVTFSFYLRPFE